MNGRVPNSYSTPLYESSSPPISTSPRASPRCPSHTPSPRRTSGSTGPLTLSSRSLTASTSGSLLLLLLLLLSTTRLSAPRDRQRRVLDRLEHSVGVFGVSDEEAGESTVGRRLGDLDHRLRGVTGHQILNKGQQHVDAKRPRHSLGGLTPSMKKSRLLVTNRSPSNKLPSPCLCP